MARSRHKLTPRLIQEITAYVRAGAFPHIAAEAAGLPLEVFKGWLLRGQTMGKRSLYHDLAGQLRQAEAQARVRAEMEVFKEDPISWLKHGPGKETPASPGFSASVKPVIHENNQQINVLLSPQMQGVFAAILQVLAPFPEARIAVAHALAGKDQPSLPK